MIRSRVKRLLSAAVLASALVFPFAAQAAGNTFALPGAVADPAGTVSAPLPLGLPGSGAAASTPTTLINAVLARALQILAALAILAIIWGGIVYVTSYGEEDKVKKGKQIILWALLGLGAALAGYAVIDIVNSFSLSTPK